MSTYLVVYDLTKDAPPEAYDALINALKKMNFAPLQRSAWVISEPFSDNFPTAKTLELTLWFYMDRSKDRLIVTPVTPGVEFIHVNDLTALL
jgi:hypothetical protein